MKKLLPFITMITLIAIVIVACKDNFNESDFLKLQSSLKTQQDTSFLSRQLKQLNDAGELLSFTVQIVEDRTPLAGVDVQISNDVTGGTIKVTTDANGNAIFSKVRVGSNTILINKTGYATATAVVDFGPLTNFFQTASSGGVTTIVSLKQSRSVILPLYSIGATGSTATITGKVTIENDFTNSKTEVPQNITLKANFASALTGTVTGSGTTAVTVTTYTFNTAGIGSAAVDNTTGNYSMKVPSTAAGVTYTLIVPEIEGSITMAGNTVNSLPANGQVAPQIFPAAMLSATDGAAQWGPLVGTYDAIPSVTGVKAVFSAPPSPGAGLSFTMAALARPLGVGLNGITALTWNTYSVSSTLDVADPTQFDGNSNAFGQTAYQVTNRGSGYTASPTINITGGGGTGAIMKASLRGYLTGLTINNAGVGYDGTTPVTVTFSYVDANSTTQNMIAPACTYTVSSGTITAINLPTSGTGFSTPWQTVVTSNPAGYNVASFKATITGGGAGVTTIATVTPIFSSEVDHIQLEKAGSGYTSAPTITFTGGGGSTQATMVVKEFRTQWSVALNNTTNTTPYSILPNGITFQFNQSNTGVTTDNAVFDQNNNSTNFNNAILASGGAVVQRNPTLVFRTNSFSVTKPAALITSSVAVQTQATVTIGADGTITNIILPTSASAVYGKGYSTPPTVSIQPMVTGAPGSGAVVDLSSVTSFNPVTGEYTLTSGATVTPLVKGSGYLSNVNQIGTTAVAFAPSGAISTTVKTGETAVLNVDYGSGKRKQKVQ
jgi:hypothetical protein